MYNKVQVLAKIIETKANLLIRAQSSSQTSREFSFFGQNLLELVLSFLDVAVGKLVESLSLILGLMVSEIL